MTNNENGHKWHDEDIVSVDHKRADDPASETVYIDMGDEGSVILNRADVVMLTQQFGIGIVEGFSPQILSEQLDKEYFIAKDAGIDTSGINSADSVVSEIEKMLHRG